MSTADDRAAAEIPGDGGRPDTAVGITSAPAWLPSAPLPREFFAREAPVVARALVGKVLYRRDVDVAARVVEVEAYTQDDPACHAYGRRTARNEPLWGPPGHAYVYRSYGVHWCFNVSTGTDGVAQGCLIRAAQPLRGVAWLRGRRPVRDDLDLLRGPAKLCQSFGITGTMSGADVCDGDATTSRHDGRRGAARTAVVGFADDGTSPQVGTGPRVGVSQAADVPWRFFATSSPWVSPYRRSPRAPRPDSAGQPLPPARG